MRKNSSYLEPIITLTIITIFIWFAIRPSIINTINTRKEQQKFKELSQKLDNKINILNNSEKIQTDYADEILLIENVIPNEPYDGELAKNLYLLAIKHKISTNNISTNRTETTVPNENLEAISFNMNIKGNYEQAMNYIEELLNYERLITLNTLNFKLSGESRFGIVEITLAGNAYYYSDD